MHKKLGLALILLPLIQGNRQPDVVAAVRPLTRPLLLSVTMCVRRATVRGPTRLQAITSPIMGPKYRALTASRIIVSALRVAALFADSKCQRGDVGMHRPTNVLRGPLGTKLKRSAIRLVPTNRHLELTLPSAPLLFAAPVASSNRARACAWAQVLLRIATVLAGRLRVSNAKPVTSLLRRITRIRTPAAARAAAGMSASIPTAAIA